MGSTEESYSESTPSSSESDWEPFPVKKKKLVKALDSKGSNKSAKTSARARKYQASDTSLSDDTDREAPDQTEVPKKRKKPYAKYVKHSTFVGYEIRVDVST